MPQKKVANCDIKNGKKCLKQKSGSELSFSSKITARFL